MGRGCRRSVLSPQRGNDDRAAKRRAQLDHAPVVLQEVVLEKPLIVTAGSGLRRIHLPSLVRMGAPMVSTWR